MQEGGEDAAVAAIFSAGFADGGVGFEDGYADGRGCHSNKRVKDPRRCLYEE